VHAGEWRVAEVHYDIGRAHAGVDGLVVADEVVKGIDPSIKGGGVNIKDVVFVEEERGTRCPSGCIQVESSHDICWFETQN